MKNEMRYTFGKNWSEFVKKHYSEERVAISTRNLLGFLRLSSLEGQSFLDIGCGSGLHSLAAYRAGASSILSFDYDPDSVATTRYLWESEGKPGNWEIMQGSVLEESFMVGLPKSDIVYSWGVLHHTGDVWKALRHASIPMTENGLLFVALYSHDVQVYPSAEFWLDVKKRYNTLGALGKIVMEWWYFWNYIFIPDYRAGQSTLKRFREYKASRGMALWTDIKDWLGGWPMEFVKILEVQDFADRELGLDLLNMTSNEANAEYLFRRKGGSNYWDGILKNVITRELAGPFERREGNCFVAPAPDLELLADTPQQPRRSPVFLMENDRRIQIPHEHLDGIKALGKGRYCHCGPALLFSSTDNSDPNTNGRRYTANYYPEG